MTFKKPRQLVRKFTEQTRNFKDPAYIKLRKEVLKRDNGCCQWHGCTSKKRLCVHHIKTWADFPHLRFVVSNCITLCREHHDLIWNKEEDFARMFMETVHQIEKNPKYALRNFSSAKQKTKTRRRGFAAKYAAAKRKQKKKRY